MSKKILCITSILIVLCVLLYVGVRNFFDFSNSADVDSSAKEITPLSIDIIEEIQLAEGNAYYKFYDDQWYFLEPIDSPRALAQSDTETFEILQSYWAKDRNHVYAYGQRLEGVNPGSFMLIELPIVKTPYYTDEYSLFNEGVEMFGESEGNIYSSFKTLGAFDNKPYLELGKMGKILTDGQKELYFRGSCSGGSYVPFEEVERYLENKTKEGYLRDYSYC